MKKREVLIFSIFGILLALTRLIEGINYHIVVANGTEIDHVQKSNRELADQLYHQIEVCGQYNNIATMAFRVLSILFLLYIGWKITYGLLGLKYIIVGTLCVFVFASLVQFAFQPKDWTVWIFLLQDITHAAAWIAVMGIYRFAWKKRQLKDKQGEI